MALCKKGGKESSQEVEEIGHASWSKENILIFCDLYIELVDKSKGKNGETISQRIRWKDIMLEFQKETNLAWSREQLKHKYDGLKVSWALCKKLKGKEVSLGWDHEKGTIAASDEWWLKKIEGIDPELESKIDELFGGHVARGDDIITPNMDAFPPPMEENEDMNNDISILGPGVSAWQELWHDDSLISTRPPISQGTDGGGNGNGKRKLANLFVDPNKSAKTNGPKRMRSAAMMYEKLDAMLEVIISKKKVKEVEREEMREKSQRKEMNNKNASGDDGAPSVPDALAKICSLPHVDHLHSVFMFASELVEDL
ncbi:hypothetical protein Cgig2_018909 [Carnegiea gigantea]|uniref:Myb/SANT-like domain-containing protein n=1 Tax=Carnegiea gigantea TaxID=171969 RepID=A0A9Q1QCD4_9CARY|nr:hypothetical protein Cgig2_018909 [Carnegiea gigantea]